MSPRGAAMTCILLHAVIFLWLFKTPGLYYETGSDTQHVYWPAAQRLLAGQVPYRDPRFFIEYPPLAAAVFLLPAALHPASLRAFDLLFAVEILLVDVATLPMIIRLARRAGVGATGAVAAYGLLIPLLGCVSVQRFDLVPAALVLAALLALLARLSLPAWLLLLAATLIKIYPAALVPLFAIHEWRRERRAGVVAYGLGLCGAVLAWGVMAPASLGQFVRWEARRGIELESVQASAVEFAHLLGLRVRILSPAEAFGSWDITSALTPALGTFSTILVTGILLSVYASYARAWPWRRGPMGAGPPDRNSTDAAGARSLLMHATLAVLALLLCSKLLSIQFLLWLLPLLAVYPYHRGRVVLFAAVATALSQSIFPFLWDALATLQPTLVVDLAVRNALLIALFVIAWRDRHRDDVPALPPPSPDAETGHARSLGAAGERRRRGILGGSI